MKRLVVLCGLIISLLVFSGCGTSAELKPYQGRWVDINSENHLDIDGDRITFNDYGYEEEYTFRIRKGEGMVCLENADSDEYGSGFGMISSLEVCSDGSLLGFVQVMDADLPERRYVREEEKAKALEIKDMSESLPAIEGVELEYFSLCFSNGGGMNYGLDERWEDGRYDWELRLVDGEYEMSFSIMGSSYIIAQATDTVSKEYADGLAQLLKENGILDLNGYHRENEADVPTFSLYADYSTGERLSIRAYGDAAKDCPFDLNILLDYVDEERFHNSF